MARTAEALCDDAPHLARLLTQAPAGGMPLLAAAFLFFFRREIENDDKLARGLTVDALMRFTAEQQAGFAELEKVLGAQTGRVLDRLDALFDSLGSWFAKIETQLDDLRRQLQELLDRNNVGTSPVSSALRISVTSGREEALLRKIRDQLRSLPNEVVEAGDWLKLGDGLAAAGDFDSARQSHAHSAATAHAMAESAIEAEAHFKAYRDACEQARWEDALNALRKAVALDRARFESFPFRRYEVLGILGIGGFGAVFHCRDRYSNDEMVAVKTLHHAELARDLKEVFAEAHVLRLLNHPGIIGIRDQAFADIDTERRPYFVLEYFAGGSLDDYRQKHGPLTPEALMPFARGIADAVHAAHRANILHRDLKPANVLARPKGAGWEVRVIDFGLAVRHAAAHASIVVPSDRRTRREQSFAGTLRTPPPSKRANCPAFRSADTPTCTPSARRAWNCCSATPSRRTKTGRTFPNRGRVAGAGCWAPACA